MTPLKEAIFAEVRTKEDKLGALNDTELNRILFHVPDSLRLSPVGYDIVRKYFTTYSFEIPITIKAKHQMALAKMEYPYALRRKRLILFSEMDAMMVKLCGDVKGFLETYSN